MIYQHKKTSDLYYKLQVCQIQIDGNWVLGILYIKYVDVLQQKAIPELFVRTMEDFNSSFETFELVKTGN